jgi:hypothetical protein
MPGIESELENVGMLRVKIQLYIGQAGCVSGLPDTYQNGKNIPKTHKIYQMSTKYIKWPQIHTYTIWP